LAAAGIPIATVRVGGGEILVTVPSDRVTDAQRAAIRGAMLFRPVREAFPAALPGAGNPDPYPGASMVERVMLTGLDCGKPAATVVDPTRAMAACSADGRTKYMLGPALFAATEIAAATAEGPAPDRGVFEWRVAVRLKPAAQAVWSQWTRGHLGSAVGIALDDRVLSAPVIASTISGATPFAADFTEDTAKSLAVVLSHGPLPVTLRLVAVGH
jgi:preprotein translocase subunit SecD